MRELVEKLVDHPPVIEECNRAVALNDAEENCAGRAD
jgi:hypothetical protein